MNVKKEQHYQQLISQKKRFIGNSVKHQQKIRNYKNTIYDIELLIGKKNNEPEIQKYIISI